LATAAIRRAPGLGALGLLDRIDVLAII